MGRPHKGEIRTKDNSTLSLTKVADGLGTSTTNLKKLMSIRKYDHHQEIGSIRE